MAAFNFEVFEADFKQRRLLQDVAELFGALRNPDDPQERLLAVEPGQPLHNFMQKIRIDETLTIHQTQVRFLAVALERASWGEHLNIFPQ